MTVVTAVVFSATLTDAVLLPPSDEITGASLVAITATWLVAAADVIPSNDAVTSIRRVVVSGASEVLRYWMERSTVR